MRGGTVTWYCPESQHIFFLSYATNPEMSDQELVSRLHEHLDALACHATD